MAAPSTSTVEAPVLAPQLLVDELLGFSPHMLLDDIVNVANTATGQMVDALDTTLQRWADAQRTLTPEQLETEIEQGLVAFQTLVEFHADVAFDYLETWSLRNIFTFRNELVPLVVAPHHQGLDLDPRAEDEPALLAELEELRVRIDTQRKLRRAAQRAKRITALQAKLHARRLERARALRVPSPAELSALLAALERVRAADEAAAEHGAPQPRPTPGVPAHEDGREGFVRWARARALREARGGDALMPALDAERGARLGRAMGAI